MQVILSSLTFHQMTIYIVDQIVRKMLSHLSPKTFSSYDCNSPQYFSRLDVTEVLNYVCLNDDFFNLCIFIS